MSGFQNQAFAGSAPIALYTFNEGRGSAVYDVSGSGTPINLTIANTSAVTWNSNGSLTVDANTMIASSTAATKVTTALKASNAVTIETWVQPSSTTQDGPARIFTLSRNAYYRNLTLGQEMASYAVRLRTTATDTNGKPQLNSPAGTLNTGLMHVLYSRSSSGVATLYINGVKQQQMTVGGNFSNWNNDYRLALSNELNGARPWLGTFHHLAVYDRAFSATEVLQAYAAGSNPKASIVNTSTVSRINYIPVAANDSASVSTTSGVIIEPLTNDSDLNDGPVTISIISGPTRGRVNVYDNKVWYRPVSDFSGNDSIIYRITDADGDWATATITINVDCSTCALLSNKKINISWNASPDQVLGYYVYYGSTANTATSFASTIPRSSTIYTTLAKDLGLKTGETVCFRIRAYNTFGVSPFTPAKCGVI